MVDDGEYRENLSYFFIGRMMIYRRKHSGEGYIRRVEKFLILTLYCFLLSFLILPKRFEKKKPELLPVSFRFIISDIPVTKQTVRERMASPEKPVIPIEAEDPSVPEDVTIDDTEFHWNLGDTQFGNSPLIVGKIDTIPPRPVMQVMPEYPEELVERKVAGKVRLLLNIYKDGQVKDVVVSENTTGEKLIEDMAIDAAFKSKYLPAKSGNKNITMWTICEYSFQPK